MVSPHKLAKLEKQFELIPHFGWNEYSDSFLKALKGWISDERYQELKNKKGEWEEIKRKPKWMTGEKNSLDLYLEEVCRVNSK
ncbi:MAG: hypothetical protein A2X20_00325 [Bacteroidetes bacterium GWE2_40_15]|nr:MAG: hypothetical protein A2X20_00325 [Bacteroidetes bacterium GWE2_40_15]